MDTMFLPHWSCPVVFLDEAKAVKSAFVSAEVDRQSIALALEPSNLPTWLVYTDSHSNYHMGPSYASQCLDLRSLLLKLPLC
jgi:hypothetical protein